MSRFRSRINSEDTVTCTQTQKTGTPPGPWYFTYSDVETMTDTITPYYQRKIADGAIINNPCTYSRASTSSSGDGSYHAVYKSTGWWYHQSGAVTRHAMMELASSLGIPQTVSEADVGSAIATLKQQAIANIAKTPWSFGEDVGEVRETLKYLKNPASSLAEVAKSFERKAKNLYFRYGNRAKALSGAWAQHRFAMLPLQRSLEDIVKSSFVRNQKEFASGSRLSARSRTLLSGNVQRTTAPGYSRVAETRSDAINLHCYILYETKNPLKGWQYKYGLRFKDIPTVGWQLLPYSFMVDRVANVSNCISGVTNILDPSIRILAAGVVRKHDKVSTCQLLADVNPQWSVTAACETVEERLFTFTRDTWYPTVSDTIPQVNLLGLVKDATSVIDLLALTTQRLKCF